MKHVSIIIPNEAVMASIVDPRTIFAGVNEFLEAAGKPPAFTIQLVGLAKEVRLHNSVFSVHCDVLVHEVEKTNLIIIPAISGNLKASVEKNQAFVPFIIKQYNMGAEVASLCIGSFLLASTGLLNGKECSSHWRQANE